MKAPPKGPNVSSVATFKIEGTPYFDVPSAARIIEAVSESTLKRWVIKGWTSFGLSLDIVQRNGRLLVPELKVFVVKDFLRSHPLPGRETSTNGRAEFKRAAELFSLIEPRSTYSRERRPYRAAPHL